MNLPLQSFLNAVRRARVPIIYNQRVDEAFLRKIRPEVLVWGVGAQAVRPAIEGLDTVPTLTSKEYYLGGRDLPGKRILIIGGGFVGLEAAEKLAGEGREVIVVEMLPEMGAGMEGVTKAMLFERLNEFSNATLLTSTTVLCISKDTLVLKSPDGWSAKCATGGKCPPRSRFTVRAHPRPFQDAGSSNICGRRCQEALRR
jgi:NADPH-dependent 2,4-dienoyl-CoA reductase/sulfur reductase-like enzyme